jgi:hypothetical protein
MSTGSTDLPGSRPRIVTALLTALVATTLAACSDDPPVASDNPEADVVDGIQRTLRQRARAIVERDPVRLEGTLAQRDRGFLAEQERYLDNLGQLPLGVVRFDLDGDSLEKDGEGYWGVVRIRLEIKGYDAAPVMTSDRWRFAPTRNERRYLLTSTTDADWEGEHGPQPQPWDLGEIEVREGPGVLGIFDTTTVASADAVVSAVSEARFEVKGIVPDEADEPGGVIVYTLADPAFVEHLDGLPVSDPDLLDGATVSVPRNAADADGPVASYRILLSPHILDDGDAVLDRLVRHELTHVVLGDRGRGAPLWLTEGVAEYVSVRPIAPAERRLQTDALNLVAAGVNDVPSDAEFAGADAEGWYAVAWWVCEYIAATYGELVLWKLLDELKAGADQQSVVFDQLGITTSELVQAGIGLMRRTYG